jgi:hypothetical protein
MWRWEIFNSFESLIQTGILTSDQLFRNEILTDALLIKKKYLILVVLNFFGHLPKKRMLIQIRRKMVARSVMAILINLTT